MPAPDRGILVNAPDSIFGGRVFFVRDGVRHWVRDARWFEENGLRCPADVVGVAAPVITSYRSGGPAPLRCTDAEFLNPPRTSSVRMREIAASPLSGLGLEVGAGASPSALPLDCRVWYADRLTAGGLVDELYPGQLREDLVVPDLETDLQSLDGIADEALDFIVACHVVEHVASPLTALANCYRRLRPGGRLLLVVPDRDRTFDRDRELTPLSHLVADHERPDRERDRQHYVEFYERAFRTPTAALPAVVERRFAERYAIHFHTWSFDSFGAMVDLARQRIAPFRSVWCQPTLPDPVADIEFYFLLTK